MVLQQSVEVFLYLVFDMHKTTTKKLVPSSKRAELQRERTTPKSRRKRRKKMQKPKNLRRFVFQISRFLRHFFLLFSLFVRRVCVGRFLSLLEHTASPISHPIVFLARFALLGFQTREREKERRNKSSVAIINTNNNNNNKV